MKRPRIRNYAGRGRRRRERHQGPDPRKQTREENPPASTTPISRPMNGNYWIDAIGHPQTARGERRANGYKAPEQRAPELMTTSSLRNGNGGKQKKRARGSLALAYALDLADR